MAAGRDRVLLALIASQITKRLILNSHAKASIAITVPATTSTHLVMRQPPRVTSPAALWSFPVPSGLVALREHDPGRFLHGALPARSLMLENENGEAHCDLSLRSASSHL